MIHSTPGLVLIAILLYRDMIPVSFVSILQGKNPASSCYVRFLLDRHILSSLFVAYFFMKRDPIWQLIKVNTRTHVVSSIRQAITIETLS